MKHEFKRSKYRNVVLKHFLTPEPELYNYSFEIQAVFLAVLIYTWFVTIFPFHHYT